MTREEWIDFFQENAETFLDDFKYCDDMSRLLKDRMGKQGKNWELQHGCSKWCFVDKTSNIVIKWSNSIHYNEMEKECLLYKLALEKGIECFFPKTELLVMIEDVGVYIQERVDLQLSSLRYVNRKELEKKHGTVKEEILQKASRGMYNSPDWTWLRMAISFYGKKKIQELGKFTKEHRINDLHDSNVGFLHGRPVLLDFSGYRRSSDSGCYSNDESLSFQKGVVS